MQIKRSASRAGALLILALATGHWAQSRPPAQLTGAETAAPVLKQIELVAARERPAAESLAVPAPLAAPAAAARDCQPLLSLSPQPGALLGLKLYAPCHAGASVTLRHGPLVFAERLDDQGRISLSLPALESNGRVSALFPDAAYASASAGVSGLEQERRFVVQFVGDDAFQLRALENGAAYGLPFAATSGQLTSLGHPKADLPMRAEIYSFPTTPGLQAEVVIEAEVTMATCGREMLGEVVVLSHGDITRADLHLPMPGCDAIGDILVLKNLVPERTLAAVH